MDDCGFDLLARRMSAVASRRRLVLGTVGAALASHLGFGVPPAAAAKPKVGGKCTRGGPSCPAQSRCTKVSKKLSRCRCLRGRDICRDGNDSICADLSRDPANCGRCGKSCLTAPERTCREGRCCLRDGADCAAICGNGALCDQCCAGACNLDGTCGEVSDCLPNGTACPTGCNPDDTCPGCCGLLCDATGNCGVLE